MILLEKLFSETGLFNEVPFHKGINLVLGKYSREKTGQGPNGVGKSTLVRLIDYALCSDGDKGYFSVKKYPFLRQHSVTLQLSVAGKSRLVRRHFEKPSVLEIGAAGQTLTPYSKAEAKQVLATEFFPPKAGGACAADPNWFRSLLRFFVKDDFRQHDRSTPLNFVHKAARTSELYGLNFYLLGLPNTGVIDFDRLQFDLRRKRIVLAELEQQAIEETGKPIQQLKADIGAAEARVALIEKGLKDKVFLRGYKSIEEELVSLSRKISDAMTRYHSVNRRLKDYEKSYEYTEEVDVAKVTRLYADLSQTFAAELKRKLDEALAFRRQIADNRRRFLLDREAEIKAQLKSLVDAVSQWEERRSTLYGRLQERRALDSMKHSYEALVETKAGLQKTKDTLNNVNGIKRSIIGIESEISEAIERIVRDLDHASGIIDELGTLFLEVVRRAFLAGDIEGAGLDIQASVNRAVPITFDIRVPRIASLGQSRFRLVAFDLTVLLHLVSSKRDLPRFLVHDGAFPSIAKATQMHVLNYVHEQSLSHPDFQYLLTANEDEMELPPDLEATRGRYEFDWRKCIVVEYTDTLDGRIFHREW
jgi:uncharacterized protein YydD (DUF2326 family)